MICLPTGIVLLILLSIWLVWAAEDHTPVAPIPGASPRYEAKRAKQLERARARAIAQQIEQNTREAERRVMIERERQRFQYSLGNRLARRWCLWRLKRGKLA